MTSWSQVAIVALVLGFLLVLLYVGNPSFHDLVAHQLGGCK